MKMPDQVGLGTAYAADLFGPERFIDQGDLGGGIALMAFTYGNRLSGAGEIAPGYINEAIAEEALRLSQSHQHRPIIAQQEVAAVLGNNCRPIDRDNGYYQDTRGFVEAAKTELDNMPLGPDDKRVVAIAHRLHVGRSLLAIIDAGIIPVGYSAVNPVPLMDKLSNERWTSGRLKWSLHETAVFAGLAAEESFPRLIAAIRKRSIAAKHTMTKSTAQITANDGHDEAA